MKRVNWHIPEAAGVNVWPNVSFIRDELGSQVRTVVEFLQVSAVANTPTRQNHAVDRALTVNC